MSEHDDVIERLAEQLAHAGVPAAAACETLRAYGFALDCPTEAAWTAFYISVYARLRELADRRLAFVGSTAGPLLTLLRDDLGVRVVDRAEMERIQARLVEYAGSEASVPS